MVKDAISSYNLHMKVLLVNHTTAFGGGTTFSYDLARGLANKGVTVTIVCLKRGTTEQEHQGFDLRVLDHGSPKIRQIQHLITQEDFDVVHAQGTRPALYVKLAYMLYRIKTPLVYTLHGIHFLHKNIFIKYVILAWEWITNRLFVNALVCVSKDNLEHAQRYRLAPGKKLYHINNGVYIPADVESHAQGGPYTVVSAGRLVYPKDFATVLRAFADLDVDDKKLYIAGDGPQRQRLEERTRALGIHDEVVFLGWQQSIIPLLRQADVFVLSTHFEGLPMTILEAMANHVPVVASDVVGVRNIVVDNETGYVFPCGDATDLAHTLTHVYQHNEEACRVAQRARSMVATQFNHTDMVTAYKNLYTECTT